MTFCLTAAEPKSVCVRTDSVQDPERKRTCKEEKAMTSEEFEAEGEKSQPWAARKSPP